MADTNLPANWRAARDSDGKEYYFNELTGETSWVVPGSDVNAATNASSVSVTAAEDGSEFAAPLSDPEPVLSFANAGVGNAGRSRSTSYSELASLVGDRILPRIILILICSFILMLQAAIDVGRKSGGTTSYAVAVGSISLGLSLALLIFARKQAQLFANYVIPKVPGELSVMQGFALFLVAWWVPAASVLTFFSPYTVTSNAYFAIWVALIASVLILGDSFVRVGDKFREFSSSHIHQDRNAFALLGMSLASIVVFCASIEYVNSGQGVYGIVIGVLSTCFGVSTYYLSDKQKIGARRKIIPLV